MDIQKFNPFYKQEIEHISNKKGSLYDDEVFAIADLFEKLKPQRMVELGTLTGCSAGIFARIAEFFGHSIKIDTYDINDHPSYVDYSRRNCLIVKHIENLTGNAAQAYDELSPDIIYVDCHDYLLSVETMSWCAMHEVPMIFHDINHDRLEDFTKEMLAGHVNNYNCGVEAFLLGECFDHSLWDYSENKVWRNNAFVIKTVRSRHGIAIIMPRGLAHEIGWCL